MCLGQVMLDDAQNHLRGSSSSRVAVPVHADGRARQGPAARQAWQRSHRARECGGGGGGEACGPHSSVALFLAWLTRCVQ